MRINANSKLSNEKRLIDFEHSVTICAPGPITIKIPSSRRINTNVHHIEFQNVIFTPLDKNRYFRFILLKYVIKHVIKYLIKLLCNLISL